MAKKCGNHCAVVSQRRAGAPAGKPAGSKKNRKAKNPQAKFKNLPSLKKDDKKAGPEKKERRGEKGKNPTPRPSNPRTNHRLKNLKKSVPSKSIPRTIGLGAAALTAENADVGSATGSTTDPSKKVGRVATFKKVGRVANTGAQNGSTAQQIMDKPFGRSVQDFIESIPHGQKSVQALASISMTAKQKKNECMKNWQRENYGG